MGAIVATPATIFLSILSARPADYVYGFKWIISYIYIRISRLLDKKRFDLYDGYAEKDPMKVDFISQPLEIKLESPLEDHELYTAADEVFIYGVNSKSEYLVTRIARNTNHEAEAWIYLKLDNGKVYQLRDTTGYQQSCCERKTFTCGDLQMNYILPMRTWRIFFNGLLKEIDENDPTNEKMVHVKFGLLWRASSDIFDFTSDVDAAALARAMAKAKWKDFTPPLEKLNKSLDFYAQCGIIMGNISVEDSDREHNIYLFGERMRFLGDSSIIQEGRFRHILGETVKKGSYIHLSEASIANIIEDLTFGFLVRPTGEMMRISDKAILLENSTNENGTETVITTKFYIEGIPHDLKAQVVGGKANFQSKTGWEGYLTMNCISFEMNAYKGLGVLINGKISKPFKRAAPKTSIYSKPKVIPFVVHFSEQTCQDSTITGGKGSSLGKLTELSKDLKTFTVPNGVVVTTEAYESFVTEDVLGEIKKLEDVLYGNIHGDIKESCEKVMEKVMECFFPEKIIQAITKTLEQAFPDKEMVKFAVRSSATGEDTEQMSAAGQMETFLGVTGTSEILHAVKKCWASQFSHIAVQYKRQNGQIINSPMAVVIQEMVPCDVAGVLFTCDPLTGNPTIMSITANYGLGESVVSASEEPDSFEIKRDADDKLSIRNKTIGAKSHRIVLKDDKGTNIEDISDKERETYCLSDKMILQLGNLAVKIEKSYRSRRDIEWGFWKNNLYIFQSRPVTSGCGESDFEIEHETDAPLRVEGDYFTVCNVGEVMPGATSQLGLDILMKYFRITFQRRIKTDWQSRFKPRYFPRGICCMYNHVMFYCCDLYERMSEDPKSNIPVMVGMFGRVLDDPDLFETIAERFEKQKKPLLAGQIQFLLLLTRLFAAKKEVIKALEAYSNYRIPIELYNTSHDMFNALLYACTDLCGPMTAHMMTSEASSVWNMFIFSILTKARGEVNDQVYNNIAQLLTTSSEVESADVPASIDRLASSIAKEVKPEEFKKMDTKDIDEWLKKSDSEAGKKYREFLQRHGHRCLKEFDVRSKTWGTDPTTLIQLLRNLVGSAGKKIKTKKDEDFDEMLKNMGLSFGFVTKMLLKFLIPQSRKAVQNREASKSLLIKSQDAWRKGYHHLAKLMVSEGRIPDEDILFFMSLDEIKELLNTRSPKIIARANHRRRRYPTMDRYIFPEIMKGFPKPINMEDEDSVEISNEENFSMKGIPVSQGVTKAYVRVALTLEEASHLQPGEILLTYSTDIGWSPYFPILAGVVTELGGLISHGAVVSREYGLPCIAGLHGATRQFRTGDYVLLDGNKGILQRLKKAENVESSL